MRLFRDRQLAKIAADNLVRRRGKFRAQTAWLHDGVERHRPALLVGGGLMAGWLLGRLSVPGALRRVGTALSLGIALLRSPLGPLSLAVVFGRKRGQSKAGTTADPQG